jgi:hypothetical protein
MQSIVRELISWTRTNAQRLRDAGVRLEEYFPKPGSTTEGNAGVAMEYDDILLTYSVWERTRLQTEFIVLNAQTRKTLIMEDKEPEDPGIVSKDLDRAVRNLLSGAYKNSEPDPKLLPI